MADKKSAIAILSVILLVIPVLAFCADDGLKYEKKVLKQEEKEKYERAKLNLTPSGYMTMEEYETLSVTKDKTKESIDAPKSEKPSDMKYVPVPSYRIVRYNDPPGSPEISLGNSFHRQRQVNSQGIVSPDYSIMVYSSVYYYPNNGSTSSDLFVIPLDKTKNNLERIKSAHVMHRNPEPLISTDKNIDNYATFRTLTPVDFSADGTKLLAKEKIGNSLDGIWKTNAWIYDFTVKNSYNLVELRDAIVYYWKENKNLDLEDKRWDITPLGFDLSNPDRVIASAAAYTGSVPVNLGIWSVDTKGQNPKLNSFEIKDIAIESNGFKIIREGVVPKFVSEADEKMMKRHEKALAKQKKLEQKKEEKSLENVYKARLKEIDKVYKSIEKDNRLKDKIPSTTSLNEAEAKYTELKNKADEKEKKLLDKKKNKELKKIQQNQEKNSKRKVNFLN